MNGMITSAIAHPIADCGVRAIRIARSASRMPATSTTAVSTP